MRGVFPNDSIVQDLDPILQAYMFHHWLQDQEEQQESSRASSILTGSFANPQAAREMIKMENPSFGQSDEEFERNAQELDRQVALEDQAKKKRVSKRQRKKINQGM